MQFLVKFDIIINVDCYYLTITLLWRSSEVWLNATVCKTVPSGSVVRIHSPPFYRDIVKRYNYGLQNRHCGFDSYYPCFYEFFGGIGEVWLTHRFVGPARVGSNPTYRPLLKGIYHF